MVQECVERQWCSGVWREEAESHVRGVWREQLSVEEAGGAACETDWCREQADFVKPKLP